jgi:polyhydroxyalkanoate synthesis repressor PhaR
MAACFFRPHGRPDGEFMAESGAKDPIIIKKYANRRLYHTGTSSYVTLEDLAQMVRAGEDFVVTDAKTGEEITRSVLTQIIFEQENKGQFLLPIAFLRQLIQFYGDHMQALVPRYLEMSLTRFMSDQDKLREQMSKGFGGATFNPAAAFSKQAMSAMDEQVRNNMAMFEEAMRAFTFPGFPAAKPADKDADPGKKKS